MTRKVDSHNSKLLANLYSEDEILKLKKELDSLQQRADSWRASTILIDSVYYTGKRALACLTTREEERWREQAQQRQEKRMRQDALLQYEKAKRGLNQIVQSNAKEGLEALGGGNVEVVGGINFFMNLVQDHVAEHISVSTEKDMNAFQVAINSWFSAKLGNLVRCLQGEDAPKAIQELGSSPAFRPGALEQQLAVSETKLCLQLFLYHCCPCVALGLLAVRKGLFLLDDARHEVVTRHPFQVECQVLRFPPNTPHDAHWEGKARNVLYLEVSA